MIVRYNLINLELNNKPVQVRNDQNLMLQDSVKSKYTRLKLMYSINSNYFNPSGEGSIMHIYLLRLTQWLELVCK